DREIIWTREPGGDTIAEAIREIVQARSFTVTMDPICEAYLFAAARAQSLRSIVRPAVDRGAIVISDRNYVSSVAFQGFGRGLGLETILEINHRAIQACPPNFLVFLDVPLDIALARTSDRAGDKFESLDKAFFEKVAEGYKAMSQHPLLKPIWHRVDAHAPVEEVFKRIEAIIKPCL
ncbi:MAG: dTMP kinase, partial [Patescibacteria group bacterium]